MVHIPPKETYYNGYRFRSRLEAKYAVFFDAMGIIYEYEPEGFSLNNGLSYLPDFYLVNLKAYFEVKGIDAFNITYPDDNHVSFEPNRENPDKVAWFVFEMYKNHPVIVVFGDPWDAFHSEEHGGKGKAFVFYEATCAPLFFGNDIISCPKNECTSCDHGKYMCSMRITYMDNERIICATDSDNWINTLPEQAETIRTFCPEIESMLNEVIKEMHALQFEKSLTIARQARFEHGERPITERNYR